MIPIKVESHLIFGNQSGVTFYVCYRNKFDICSGGTTNHLVLERVQKTEGKGPGKFLLSHNEGGLIAPVCCIKLFGTLDRLLSFREYFVSVISSILEYNSILVL